MIPKEIHVSVRYVKNLGNYQSYTAEAGVTAQVEDDETAEQAFETAWDMTKQQIRSQIAALKNNQEVDK
jgi:hypothetical protein